MNIAPLTLSKEWLKMQGWRRRPALAAAELEAAEQPKNRGRIEEE
jgi:hypothetical protein